MDNTARITEMCTLQDQLNTALDTNWRERDWDFGLAIISESMELIDHTGWKWWKATPQVSDTQLQLELVDIWHFILSSYISSSEYSPEHAKNFARRVDELFASVAESWGEELATLDASTIERFTRHAAGRLQHSVLEQDAHNVMTSFAILCAAYRLSIKDLHRLYVPKSVLNLFRWSNGYKEGHYIKQWFGEEDNAYLEKIVREKPHLNSDELRDALRSAYQRVLDANAPIPTATT